MKHSSWRNFDWLLFCITLTLVMIGWVMIYSSYEASLPDANKTLWENTVFRQMIWTGVGLIAYLAMTAIDYSVFLALHRWIYAFAIAVLVVTMFVGQARFGAQSWIDMERFMIQPSELCKVLMIIVLARSLGAEDERMESVLPFLSSAALALPPVLLIYLQPDFGTALILFATWLGMVFLAGVRWRHMMLLAVGGLIATPLVWFQLKDYMQERVFAFFFPDHDPSGASYNVNQALISIGSGGWLGKGILQGTQSQLHFLRVRHTDFIFSVLAEEFGFLGSVLVIALFAGLILRLVRIASLARDPEGRLIAGGVAAMILTQTIINLGMNANLMPVTGLTLPLISYGGSSLITTLMALGLAQNVVLRHKGPEYELFR